MHYAKDLGNLLMAISTTFRGNVLSKRGRSSLIMRMKLQLNQTEGVWLQSAFEATKCEVGCLQDYRFPLSPARPFSTLKEYPPSRRNLTDINSRMTLSQSRRVPRALNRHLLQRRQVQARLIEVANETNGTMFCWKSSLVRKCLR